MMASEVETIAQTHRCAECNGRLVASWEPAPPPNWGQGRHVLKCTRDPSHHTFRAYRATKRLADGRIYDVNTQRPVDENQALAIHVERFTLPDRTETQRQLDAIRAFQMACRQHLANNHDYGTIPGTSKPTLLKPGAEKIIRLLGLADEYEIVEHTKDWDKPFFDFQIRCRLTHLVSGAVVTTGLGECNSMESKYRWRWVFRSELDKLGMPPQGLPTRPINTKNGQSTQYRIDNEDIYSQVNTILKMAKKRALVDAALSAGRLSEIFTQDLEDMADVIQQETPQVRARPVDQERQRQAPPRSERPQSREIETGEVSEGDKPDPKKPDYQVFYEAARAKGYQPPREALTSILNVNDWNDWVKMGGDLPTALKRLEKMEAKES